MRTEIDYNTYHFSKKERISYIIMGCGYFFVMGMVFFNNVFFALLACSLVGFYMKEKKKAVIRLRKEKLREQFKEGMYALASALSAGRSVEQAFMVSLKDLALIYKESDDIVKEWQSICYKISMNETVESALGDFAKRSGLEDVENFASVFTMAKRSGGNIVAIINETSRLIKDKIEIQKEIDVLIVQKQFEQKILSYIIPGMILFFAVVSPDFLEPLYTTVIGRIIMVIALGMYLLAGEIGKRIVTIEV